MSFQVKGKIVQISQPMTGKGKTGNDWVKQEFVLEIPGNYPKKACFTAWGDTTQTVASLKQGSEATIHFDVESREYNGRWYTDLKAWKIEAGSGEAPENTGYSFNYNEESAAQPADLDDDLPF